MSNIHPGLILIATGLLALILPSKIRQWVSLIGPALALAALLGLKESSSMTMAFTDDITMELLKVDILAWAFGLVCAVISVIAGIYSFKGCGRAEKAAALIYAGSSMSVVFAGDWISLICFWELMAVSSCYLVWAGKTLQARRACFRYLVMHFFGGNMLLGGALVVMMKSGMSIGLLTDAGSYGYWMVLIGVAVNGAIPPLHTWVPDAYPEASPSGTVYMGSFTTKVAIYALIRLFAGTEWLVIVGAIMAVLGACMALIENDLRRLLSYHIVSQLGMMVAALGTGSAAGIDGATLHAMFNILYKGVLLMGAGAIFVATGKRKISDLGGLARKMPLVAVCFLIGSLSIAGMPFLNGFASKALIMEALHGYTLAYWLVSIAGVGTWLSITLKINYFVFFGKTDNDVKVEGVPAYMKIAMVIGALLCVVTGILPSMMYQLMPGGTMAHPFAVDHILEYIGLFIGASIPFMVFIKKMAPHDMISLDFDWFYRKPLAFVIFGFSKLVNRFFGKWADYYGRVVKLVQTAMNNPGKVFTRAVSLREDDEDGEVEDERPVGEFMLVFVAFMAIAFLVAMAITT